MQTSHKKYDVFISFRGEDTRKTFIMHLHRALMKENIDVFVDNNLKRGDEVWASLVEAIKDSHISLVVFSKNYANSTWCLNELVKILQCRKLQGQVVIPVFYNIDPSHVRKQKESYEIAFGTRYQRKSTNEKSKKNVSDWKKALKEAANISGWDSRKFSDDASLIENVVTDVWKKLSLLYPKNFKGIIIDENYKQVESLLKRYSRIGIWGMGGIGKTTIARVMFSQHSAQYDSVCFMEKVNEQIEKLGPTQVLRNDQGLKHSRLRSIEQFRSVLKNNKGADVEGIQFDLSQKEKLCDIADTFNMMVNLRFLRLYVPKGEKRLTTLSHSDQDIIRFPDKLTYLEWNGYPLKSIPDPFCAKHLVEIRLPHSNVEYLWHGMQELANLEAIVLSNCKHLIKLPDLSRASKLRSLYLSGCKSLCEIQPSIFSKDTLVTLLLDRCTKLESLKSKKHLRSLQKINVFGCSSLKEFSLSSDSMESLDLSNTGVEILHSSISGMSKLGLLNLEGLKLSNLPIELSCLELLTELRLSYCDIVTKLKLKGIFDGLGSLRILYLKHCGNLLELPTNIGSLSSLYEIRLDGSSLEMLPSSMKFLSQLEILCLNNCIKLHSLPELPLEIKEIHAENCTSLVTVSRLRTFSEQMKGKKKYISFKNDMMMNSNRQHVSKTTQFGCRQLQLQQCSVVISPSTRMKNKRGSGAKIQCKCYGEDGNRVGLVSEWYSEPITNLNMDHVFVWYDPYHSDSILDKDRKILSFEFNLTTDNDGFFSMKQCGICPVLSSEERERCDEEESTNEIIQIQNQKFSYDSLIGLLRYMWRLIIT
ncbi:disease resistance protein DSC1 [Trifolium repens]|nr:disease resistance protein DSC1 [Trifolium repens]